MVLVSRRLVAVLAILAIGSASVATAAPITDIVFGNLGASGTNALSNVNNDITTTDLVAVPFTTGSGASTPLVLQSISLGLFYDTFATGTFSLSIYQNNAGVPSPTVAYTSVPQAIGNTGLYSFSFGNAVLSPNTTYWIQPSPGLSWYTPNNSLTPVAYNSSGYSWPGNGLVSFDSGATWGTDEQIFNARYSFSVSAVPEPSTVALAAAGLGLAGLLWFRRRNSAT